MVVIYLDPNGNANTLWIDFEFNQINDETRQSDVPDFANVRADPTDDNENQTYNLTDTELPAGWRVTNITLWAYGGMVIGSTGTTSPFADINLAGCNEKDLVVPASGVEWHSVSWSDSDFGIEIDSQAEINAITLSINSKTCINPNKGGFCLAFTGIYLEVTIIQTIIGPANIAKWNGIETANLAKWNGVNWSDLAKYNGID